MPKFGRASRKRLEECDHRIRAVFYEAVKHFDCAVICGRRGKADQDTAFASGNSKAKWGESPHNRSPSMAADVYPYPISFGDRDRFHLFAGHVLGVAATMGVDLRWGGDWDQDTQVNDNDFDDLAHFEISGWALKSEVGTPT
jgi:hypothetical protein